MEVKSIIRKVLEILQNVDLYSRITSNDATITLTSEEILERDIIIDCINLVQQNIATNYFNLIDTFQINNTYDVLPYSKISTLQIFNILSVKNTKNEVLKYTLKPSGIVTNKCDIVIKYAYFPNDVTINDNITTFPIGVSERIFVYGVVSEYMFVKGNIDEYNVWQNKFETEIENVKNNAKKICHSANLKRRRWE